LSVTGKETADSFLNKLFHFKEKHQDVLRTICYMWRDKRER